MVSKHLFSLHLACLLRATKESLKVSLLQPTLCPEMLGRSWLLQAIHLPAYTKISLGFSETQNDPRNQSTKEPVFSITFPFHTMKTRRRHQRQNGAVIYSVCSNPYNEESCTFLRFLRKYRGKSFHLFT